MIRNDVNANLRDFARTLSPTEDEKNFVQQVYGTLQKLLGSENCIQIGSYPRFTATTPLHDLDILYVLGEWPSDSELGSPDSALNAACTLIRQEYRDLCPDGYTFKAETQNHSVVIEFSGKREISVDVVPCYKYDTNLYGDPRYRVPHVIKEKDRTKRHSQEWDPTNRDQWILSDPRGYITQATEVGANQDFRKAVKIAKHWKRTLRDIDDSLKLKSFHLEQVITQQFQAVEQLDLLQALFDFFIDLPDVIDNSNQIEDRAQIGKYIDDYLKNLSDTQKQKISRARDMVLIRLENIDKFDAEAVFTAKEYFRDPNEQFMFDQNVLMCNDLENDYAKISCSDGLNRFNSRHSKHQKDDELYFNLANGARVGMSYYWKVKNSKTLLPNQRRGEINKDSTTQVPERIEYPGVHYVECFAVNVNSECISRYKHEVEK